MEDIKWTVEMAKEFAAYLNKTRPELFAEYIPSNQKAKQVFLTEDGVVLSEDDKMFVLSTYSWIVSSNPLNVCQSPFEGEKNQFKYFSTKHAAEKYRIENKPCLSYNDIKEAAYLDDEIQAILHIHIDKLIALIKNRV
jgi:hypothetical protein